MIILALGAVGALVLLIVAAGHIDDYGGKASHGKHARNRRKARKFT